MKTFNPVNLLPTYAQERAVIEATVRGYLVGIGFSQKLPDGVSPSISGEANYDGEGKHKCNVWFDSSSLSYSHPANQAARAQGDWEAHVSSWLETHVRPIIGKHFGIGKREKTYGENIALVFSASIPEFGIELRISIDGVSPSPACRIETYEEVIPAQPERVVTKRRVVCPDENVKAYEPDENVETYEPDEERAIYAH